MYVTSIGTVANFRTTWDDVDREDDAKLPFSCSLKKMNNIQGVPSLLSLRESDIAAFLAAYRKYERDIEEMNRGRPRTQSTNTRSLESCVQEDLMAQIVQGWDDVEEHEDQDVVDERLREYLESQMQESSRLDSGLQLRKLVGEIHMDLQIKSVAKRVTQFRADLAGVLRRIGHQPDDWFKDKVKFTKLAKILVDTPNVLQPVDLRSWMKMTLEKPDGQQMTVVEFSNELIYIGENLNIAHIAHGLSVGYGFRTAPGSRKKKSSQRRSPKVKKRKPESEQESANSEHPQKKRVRRGRNRRNHDGTRRPPRDVTCWGCGQKGHTLYQCPVKRTDEEVQKIVQQKQDERRQALANKDSQEYMDLLSCRLAGDEASKFTVRLNNRLVPVILDDGSDRSIVSQAWLHEFQRLYNGDIPLFALQEEREITLADPQYCITTSSYIELDISFPVYDNLFLRQRQFFVVDQDIGVPIIGHSELEEIGIDPKSTLDRLSYRHIDDQDDSFALSEEYSSTLSLDMALQQMLKRAKDNKMPHNWWLKLCQLVRQYKEIFRVELTQDPPADVTPMDVSIIPGKETESWHTYNRKYTQQERKWLKNHIDSLVASGFLRRNPHARYASPALVIPKPGRPGEYRLCVDVKRANSIVASAHWPMPHFEVIKKQLGNSNCYASLDAFKGYWLFPATPLCGELYSIKTPFGVFTPNRIIQGAKEAVRYFQAGMEEALHIGDREDILLWVDDILTHASTPGRLLSSLEHIFRCCRDRKIRLSARKCHLYLEEVTWCGRTISSRGIGFDPAYIQGIKDLEQPKNCRRFAAIHL